MERYETVVDKRKCVVDYISNVKEMHERIDKNGSVLEIKYYCKDDELVTIEQFHEIFKVKEKEILLEIKFILDTDIYKNVNLNRHYITLTSGINPFQHTLYGNNKIYADDINFGYTHN
ncbi:hypothetical protein [Flavobacterium sp. N1736]|uniref:hypothetical protein n=1 Tax=Flavobacterium sp. N1736 TaxID=2986823 RepID=UPI002224D250|nr:hypothetical protein [Flavobacterium sp. N1736]